MTQNIVFARQPLKSPGGFGYNHRSAHKIREWQVMTVHREPLRSAGGYFWAKLEIPFPCKWSDVLVSNVIATDNPLNTPRWAQCVVWLDEVAQSCGERITCPTPSD